MRDSMGKEATASLLNVTRAGVAQGVLDKSLDGGRVQQRPRRGDRKGKSEIEWHGRGLRREGWQRARDRGPLRVPARSCSPGVGRARGPGWRKRRGRTCCVGFSYGR